MDLRDLGEFGLIDRISSGCVVDPGRSIRGIGDDAAVMDMEAGHVLLVTTDMLLEGVHFDRATISARDLGAKALCVNLSDIAAMGGKALDAFVSLGISPDVDLAFLDEFYRGLKHQARQFNVNIMGGDTTRSAQGLVVSITVTGQGDRGQVLYRSGARVGDVICLTGTVGASSAGLFMLQRGLRPVNEAEAGLVDAHIRPLPHLAQGRFLAQAGTVHAAIDISDGLAADLGHIVRQSRVGARLFAGQLPVPEALTALAKRHGRAPQQWILHGGEDYVLAICVDAGSVRHLQRAFKDRFQCPLHAIGEIIASDTIELVDVQGQATPLPPNGWDHFTPP
jgi:thiamine-monophosphate kinase